MRLGWRERAHGLLDFFFSDRRPAAWNQWAEVIGRNAREPRFVGDMPHAWVASDFIRAAIDLFAYERGAERALVIAAGVRADWLDGDGVALENLRTPYGPLSYTLQSNGEGLVLSIGKDSAVPPGGLVFNWPFRAAPGATTVNGQSAEWRDGKELVLRSVPTEVSVQLAGRQ